MKLLLLLLFCLGLTASEGRDSVRYVGTCEPYGEVCRACKNCTRCRHCSVDHGWCPTCLPKHTAER